MNQTKPYSWGSIFLLFALLLGKAMTWQNADASSFATEASWVGQTAPDFTLRTMDGKAVRLCDLKGKVVVLDFWASWCGPCLRELPSIEKLHREYKGKDVILLGVNAEDPEDARALVQDRQYTFPTLLDEGRSVTKLYQIRAIPTVIVIDPRGLVSEHFVGVRAERDLRAAIQQAQTGTVQAVAAAPQAPTLTKNPKGIAEGKSFAPAINDLAPKITQPTVSLNGTPHPSARNVILPIYPEAAKAAKVSGQVQVQVLTTAQGKVASAQALSGDPTLHAACVAAAKQWTFQPTLTFGQPTPTEYRITFVFELPQ